MGTFLDSLKTSKITNEGPKLAGPGEYEVEITSSAKKRSYQFKGDMLLVEMKIVVTDPAHAESLPPGKVVSWTNNLSEEAAHGSLISLLAAAAGVNTSDEKAVKAFQDDDGENGLGKAWEAVEGTSDALKGVRVRAKVSGPRTSKNGNTYHRVIFAPAGA